MRHESDCESVSSVSAVTQVKPLTDPSDLLLLLGRFVACLLLFGLTVTYFIKGRLIIGAILAVASLLLQRATVKLLRRLREERRLAEAEQG